MNILVYLMEFPQIYRETFTKLPLETLKMAATGNRYFVSNKYCVEATSSFQVRIHTLPREVG